MNGKDKFTAHPPPRMPTVREVTNTIDKGFTALGKGSAGLRQAREKAPSVMDRPADMGGMLGVARLENRAAKSLPPSDTAHLVRPAVRTTVSGGMGIGLSTMQRQMHEAHPDVNPHPHT